MLKSLLKFAALVIILACANVALADTWTEVGDAGDLPGTAQQPTGTNPLTSITGAISVGTDADMYRIFIPVGATFSATTVGTAGTMVDTQLYLFNSAGFGVYFNDDASGSTTRSLLPAGNPNSPVAPGVYYLVITGFDRDPASAGGEIWADTPFTTVRAPDGPGAGSPIIGYVGTNGSTGMGTYTINLTGAEFVPAGAVIPEPATMFLLGTGLASLAWKARRRRL